MKDLGARLALRVSTRSDHETLDGIVGAFSDTGSYARYLAGMTAFRGAVERGLADVDYPDSFGGWRPAMILPQLKQDLLDIGRPAPCSTRAFEVPEDRHSLLGVLYVMEGSSLGARLLCRRAAALGYSADHGARHLAAQTARPEAWKMLVTLLDAITPPDTSKAVQAARMTFRAAIDAFRETAEHERAY